MTRLNDVRAPPNVERLDMGDAVKIRPVLACLLAASAALAVTALPADAAAPEAISQCSDNTSYGFGTFVEHDSYLTKDLTCQKGFVIAKGATLDMRGHTLTGTFDPYTCDGAGCPDMPEHYQVGHAAIVMFEGTVKNGRLDNWDSGMSIGSGPGGSNARNISRMVVTNMRFEGVNAGENADTVSISWSFFSHSGVAVQGVYGGGFNIDHTAFADNAAGVDVTYGTDLTVTDSVFTGNGSSLSSQAGYGPVTIKRSAFVSNRSDGARVVDNAQPVNVGKNVASRNKGHGLVFTGNSGGVVDLGGNQASRNGQDPQCVGVACR